MNVFSRLRNLSWPSPSCCYQMNGIDIRLGYTNLWGILDGKRTIHYESISDILISMFSGINKCSQGRNIFMIDCGSSWYQKFVISLICISAEFPAYTVGNGSESKSDLFPTDDFHRLLIKTRTCGQAWFHANIIHRGCRNGQHMEFLWVRWFGRDMTCPAGKAVQWVTRMDQ